MANPVATEADRPCDAAGGGFRWSCFGARCSYNSDIPLVTAETLARLVDRSVKSTDFEGSVSPDNKAGTITITGKAEPIALAGTGDCAGKTLEQLRSAGLAFYLQS